VAPKVAEQREQPASSPVTSAKRLELLVVAAGHRADRVEGGEDERLLGWL
jgi:hypothetical protein